MPNIAAGSIQSRLENAESAAKPLLVCIHGGGCNARYFDLPGFSFRDRAVARGFPLLLVNRPGHGGSAPDAGADFGAAAAAIAAHAEQVIATRRTRSDWFVVGHSIGGAVGVVIAGEIRPRGLRGLALSGIGDRPTPSALAWADELRWSRPDAGLAEDLLFGPPGSFSWRAPRALRHAVEAWRPAEVEETLRRWPTRFRASARRVEVPVHLRLAEAERIWEAGPAALERLAGRFERAPLVDASLLPEGGHLYEVHRRGGELMNSQLDFFDEIGTRLDSGAADGVPARP